jgi:hypothetical protein
MRALRYARVSYSPTRAYEIGAAIGSWAAAASTLPEYGPGLSQADAVDFGIHLTILRGICKAGSVEPQEAACYDNRGKLMGVRTWNERYHGPVTSSLPIYGEERQRPARFGSGQLGPAWPRDLALALGAILCRLRDAPQGPDYLPDYAIPTTSGAARVSLIVAGPVVSIMQKAANWRYLDAALLTGIGYVGAAASAFETRLRAMEGNRVEIPPTPIELAAADQVRDWARTRYNRDTLIGAGTLFGGATAITLISAIRSRAEA